MELEQPDRVADSRPARATPYHQLRAGIPLLLRRLLAAANAARPAIVSVLSGDVGLAAARTPHVVLSAARDRKSHEQLGRADAGELEGRCCR